MLPKKVVGLSAVWCFLAVLQRPFRLATYLHFSASYLSWSVFIWTYLYASDKAAWKDTNELIITAFNLINIEIKILTTRGFPCHRAYKISGTLFELHCSQKDNPFRYNLHHSGMTVSPMLIRFPCMKFFLFSKYLAYCLFIQSPFCWESPSFSEFRVSLLFLLAVSRVFQT